MEDMEQIYNEYSRQVYRYIFSLCHNGALTEELTQETFYRAVKNINSYNGNCKMYVWLCQIAKHVWYQELQRSNKISITELEKDILSTQTTLEEEYLQKENRKDFFHILHCLPDSMREIVYLRIIGDFSFREIGEIIGKDENWARVNYYRAKQKIMKGRI